MTNDISELEKKVKNHFHLRRWDTHSNLKLDFENNDNLINARINLMNWQVNMTIDPNIFELTKKLLDKTDIITKNPTNNLIYAAADHEHGHWNYCPFDIEYLERILFGVSTGLKELRVKDDEIESMTSGISNLFEDYIDNVVNAIEKRDGVNFSEGMGMFYLNQIVNHDPDVLYSSFIDAQMKIIGDVQTDNSKANPSSIKSFRQMAETTDNYKESKKIAKEILNIMIGNNLAKIAFNRTLTDQEKEIARVELLNKRQWEYKAEKFTKLIFPYYQKENMFECCGFTNQVLKDPDLRKKIIEKAIGNNRLPGKGMPYFNSQETFETAYELKSDEIVTKFFKDCEEGYIPTLIIGYTQHRIIEDEESLNSKINFGKTILVNTPNGKKPIFFKKENPITVEDDSYGGRKSLQDILFVVDVSGSMGWREQAFDESNYDLALRSIFGVIKGLEKLERASHIKYGMILFSETTEFSGWDNYYNLKRFKKLAFTGYQGGDTVLDPSVLEMAKTQNPDKYLTLIISDGGISNKYNPIPTIKNMIETGNDVIQFSINGETDFSNKIKESGGMVIPVIDSTNLCNLVLEKTIEKYI